MNKNNTQILDLSDNIQINYIDSITTPGKKGIWYKIQIRFITTNYQFGGIINEITKDLKQGYIFKFSFNNLNSKSYVNKIDNTEIIYNSYGNNNKYIYFDNVTDNPSFEIGYFDFKNMSKINGVWNIAREDNASFTFKITDIGYMGNHLSSTNPKISLYVNIFSGPIGSSELNIQLNTSEITVTIDKGITENNLPLNIYHEWTFKCSISNMYGTTTKDIKYNNNTLKLLHDPTPISKNYTTFSFFKKDGGWDIQNADVYDNIKTAIPESNYNINLQGLRFEYAEIPFYYNGDYTSSNVDEHVLHYINHYYVTDAYITNQNYGRDSTSNTDNNYRHIIFKYKYIVKATVDKTGVTKPYDGLYLAFDDIFVDNTKIKSESLLNSKLSNSDFCIFYQIKDYYWHTGQQYPNNEIRWLNISSQISGGDTISLSDLTTGGNAVSPSSVNITTKKGRVGSKRYITLNKDIRYIAFDSTNSYDTSLVDNGGINQLSNVLRNKVCYFGGILNYYNDGNKYNDSDNTNLNIAPDDEGYVYIAIVVDNTKNIRFNVPKLYLCNSLGTNNKTFYTKVTNVLDNETYTESYNITNIKIKDDDNADVLFTPGFSNNIFEYNINNDYTGKTLKIKYESNVDNQVYAIFNMQEQNGKVTLTRNSFTTDNKFRIQNSTQGVTKYFIIHNNNSGTYKFNFTHNQN